RTESPARPHGPGHSIRDRRRHARKRKRRGADGPGASWHRGCTTPPRTSSRRATLSIQTERFSYDDATVRKFVFATILWGVVAMLVGLTLALQLAAPALTLDLPFLTFGRLRPLHTNAAIFAFAGNAVFAAVYYSSQRLLKARMFSDVLSKLH